MTEKSQKKKEYPGGTFILFNTLDFMPGVQGSDMHVVFF